MRRTHSQPPSPEGTQHETRHRAPRSGADNLGFLFLGSAMLTTIHRSYYCESAHFLPLVPEGHKCKRMHGHHYRIDVAVEGVPDQRGWVLDFWDLDEVFEPLRIKMDHHLLNEIPGLENPTAEVIAAWIARTLEPLLRAHDSRLRLAEVSVFETPDCCATVIIPPF